MGKKEQSIEIYQTKDKKTQIEVKFEGETIWLTQQQITELFRRDRTVITRHINNIFKEGELDRKSNVQKMHIAFSDKPVALYNLDVIILLALPRPEELAGRQHHQIVKHFY